MHIEPTPLIVCDIVHANVGVFVMQVGVLFSLEYFRKRNIGIETPVNALLVRHNNLTAGPKSLSKPHRNNHFPVLPRPCHVLSQCPLHAIRLK